MKLILMGAAVGALLGGGTVATAEAQQATDPAATPAAKSEVDTGLADIVVTAQRIEGLASKTPVTLSAINGDVLRESSATNPTVLGEMVPNLSIVESNGLLITIRGVTSNDNDVTGDPSAAFLLDGVYLARQQEQDVSFFDVSRVEVLRGPQGTLYGRNTTAGVVNVITNKPVDTFEVAANIGYGSYGTVQGDAMVNVPVNSRFALRFAGAYDKRDSYLYQDAGDNHDLGHYRDNQSGRLQALLTLSDSATLLLRGDYSRMTGNQYNSVWGTRWYQSLTPGEAPYTDPLYIGSNFSSKQLRQIGYMIGNLNSDNNTRGIAAELNWGLGPLALTYLGSCRDFSREDLSFTNFPLFAQNLSNGTFKENSQELRFATTGSGPLKVQFGGYYFRMTSEDAFYLLNAIPGLGYFGFPEQVTAKNYAGFGQATYAVLPDLRITLGARYSKDDKSRNGFTVFQVGSNFNPATDRRSLNDAATDSSRTTWRAGVDYDVNDHSLLYGTVSTGYKAGGFNTGCTAGSSSGGVTCFAPISASQLYYKPETLTAYELGLKTRTSDNLLRFNAAAFYYDYKDMQLSAETVIGGVPQRLTTNAGKSSIAGVELEATAALTPRNRLGATVNYLDAHYVDYSPLGSGTPPDYSGRPLDHAPKETVSLDYTYIYPLPQGATLEFGVRTLWSNSYVVTDFTVPQQLVQPSYTRTNLSMIYRSSDDHYYVQGYVNNVENDVQLTFAFASRPTWTVSPSAPRTFGIRTGLKF